MSGYLSNCLDCERKGAGIRRETNEDDMLEAGDRNPTHRTTGLVLHWAVPYMTCCSGS